MKSDSSPSEIMVTDHTRNAIWQDLWDAERYYRYYSSLSDSYRRRHRLTRFATLASVLVEATLSVSYISTGVAGFWATVILSLIVALGIAIAILVAWDATSNYAGDAVALSWVSVDCMSLNAQWTDLWLDIESFEIDEGEARSRQRELIRKFNTIAARIDVDLDEKTNEVSAADAEKVLREKYAH